MPKYIQKRRRRWYAVLDVPKDVREAIGKPRFVQSLEIESESVALRRVAPLVARWKGEIEVARTGSRDPVEQDALFWRNALSTAKDGPEHEATLERIQEITEAMIQKGAPKEFLRGPTPDWGEFPNYPEGERFYGIATGKAVRTEDKVEEWLATLEDEAKTKDQKKSDVQRLAARFPLTREVTKKDVRLLCDQMVQGDGLKMATVRRSLYSWRGYWRYLQAIEVVPEDVDPFGNLNLPKRGRKKNGKADERRAFEAEDVVRLQKVAKEPRKGTPKGDAQLADLITLGMWTGARLEELCSLKCDKVKKGYFEIEDAKTKAGWRQVPIHPKLKKTMDRLVADSKDGFVLSGLTKNKYGDRSNAIGKRFGRLKNWQGFGPNHVYHSIRRTVVTILINAGVEENVVAGIVGHEHYTMTGRYLEGLTLETKRKAIEKINYPDIGVW